MTADELTAIRQRLGLGPVDMGRALGVAYSTYRDWQSGKVRRIHPSAARLAQLLTEIDRDTLTKYIADSTNTKVV